MQIDKWDIQLCGDSADRFGPRLQSILQRSLLEDPPRKWRYKDWNSTHTSRFGNIASKIRRKLRIKIRATPRLTRLVVVTKLDKHVYLAVARRLHFGQCDFP